MLIWSRHALSMHEITDYYLVACNFALRFIGVASIIDCSLLPYALFSSACLQKLMAKLTLPLLEPPNQNKRLQLLQEAFPQLDEFSRVHGRAIVVRQRNVDFIFSHPL